MIGDAGPPRVVGFYCIYCATDFPNAENVQVECSNHVYSCSQHPMREAERETARMLDLLKLQKRETADLATQLQKARDHIATVEAQRDNLTREVNAARLLIGEIRHHVSFCRDDETYSCTAHEALVAYDATNSGVTR
jgi:septal ring factor EnvC (AmiA/AmiB activator)